MTVSVHRDFQGLPMQFAFQRGRIWLTLLLVIIGTPIVLGICGALGLSLALLLANDRLPSMDALTDYKPKVPLRIFTSDGVQIGEFGEERRSLVKIADVPPLLTNAILAAEDSRFFEHGGVDFKGILRAFVSNVSSGGKEQGASTITMQLARNFFLSTEKSYSRKIYEILVALRIEDSLTKPQILEIYINQIFLGNRSYGFASASQTYFGKPLNKISPAEAAMLAGLPKAPSRYNPLVNLKRATERQHHILRRMHEANVISKAELDAALVEVLKYQPTSVEFALSAPYVSEMARQFAVDLYKDEAYTAGLTVYTTIRAEDQKAANAAVKQGVLEYDRKYGYRGPESFVTLSNDSTKAEEDVENALAEIGDVDEFVAAIVLQVSPRNVRVSRGKGSSIDINPEGLRFAANYIGDRMPGNKRLQRGAVIRIIERKNGQWDITQLPEVQGAIVACDTSDGGIRALVGGFHFDRNKFNRVTQSIRQPGSSFKPFIYSAALEKGFMMSTVINDAPVHIDAGLTGGVSWEPKNYDGRFDGPMRLRTGLAKSKNMVSIRILQNIGSQYAQDYVSRFGFDPEKNPPYMTMALGAGSATPLQMVGAFSVFANGGFKIEPYIVSKITDQDGKVLAQARPNKAGDESIRAIDSRNAFIMDVMLKDVVKIGTATRALSLKRGDLAGKTGTTNDSHDAWFAGYQPTIAAVAWVGYDQPRNLGEKETGGGLALPIWINYMGKALRGVPEIQKDKPTGIVGIGNDFYYSETQPGQGIASVGVQLTPAIENVQQVRDQVF
jgi:penicillin-binding protein 1A